MSHPDGIPLVRSPLFSKYCNTWFSDPDVLQIARQLHYTGIAELDFPDRDLAGKGATVIDELTPQFDFDSWRADGAARARGLRAQDAWKTSATVRELATNARMIDLLSRLYGRPAFPFQTLNFPVGSQQDVHSDAAHFSSVPFGYVCGVWLALEDIDESNGPLLYYPESHRLPFFSNDQLAVAGDLTTTQEAYTGFWSELLELSHLEPHTVRCRRGKAYIWDANLFHGGAPHLDLDRTRWTQVTHYYFHGCRYYTPMHSNALTSTFAERHPFDVTTGAPVVIRKHGLDASNQLLPKGFSAGAYLKANPDVAAAGVDAKEHYLKFGRFENRRIFP